MQVVQHSMSTPSLRTQRPFVLFICNIGSSNSHFLGVGIAQLRWGALGKAAAESATLAVYYK